MYDYAELNVSVVVSEIGRLSESTAEFVMGTEEIVGGILCEVGSVGKL